MGNYSYYDILNILALIDEISEKDYDGNFIDDKELVMYSYEMIGRDKSKTNILYPLLMDGLEKQFDKYVKPYLVSILSNLNIEAILDVGSGNGHLLSEIKDYANILIGIDNKFHPASSDGKIKFVKGDFIDFSPETKFDVIIMSEFLHLFDDKTIDEFIKKSMNLLNKNGNLLIIENRFDKLTDRRLRAFGGKILDYRDYDLDDVVELDRHWIGIKKKGL